VVDPPSCPIDLWLHRSEPRVPEDDFVVAQVGEEVSQIRSSGSGPHAHVDIVL